MKASEPGPLRFSVRSPEQMAHDAKLAAKELKAAELARKAREAAVVEAAKAQARAQAKQIADEARQQAAAEKRAAEEARQLEAARQRTAPGLDRVREWPAWETCPRGLRLVASFACMLAGCIQGDLRGACL